MTNDKALEAARECPWHGDNSNLTVEDNGVGCFWVVCGKNNCGCEGPYASSPEEAIAAWNRRAPLSALPGEAEVKGYLFRLRYGPDNWSHQLMFSAVLPKEGDAKEIEPLVTLASLQAMQARAEKAERERDALREALKPSGETKAEYIGEFTIAVERHVNSDEEVDDEGEGAMDPYEHVTVPWTTIKEIMAAISERAARTALTGGSNG